MMQNRRSVARITFTLLAFALFPTFALGNGTDIELLESWGLEIVDCPEAVAELSRREQRAVCGRFKGKPKSVWKKVDGSLSTLFKSSGMRVFDSKKVPGTELKRIAYWTGSGNFEAVLATGDSVVALISSKLVQRCGPELPFQPSLTGGETMQIFPLSYPTRAHSEKIDGSAALAIKIDADGTPHVHCLHHASPRGYGFAFSALEAVYRGDIEAGPRSETSEPIHVLVTFSSSGRRRGQGAVYH